MKTVAFYTLGCKVNQYETEAMTELFTSNGYKTVDFDSEADIYVINTCTVTNMSDRKSRQIIRRAKKNNLNSIVIVTGCYAQTAPEDVAKIEGVNLILGTQDRKNIVSLAEKLLPDQMTCGVSDIMHNHSFEDLHIQSYSDNRTRAYIKVQEGCSQFCSYCIIPYARGPIRSRPIDEVLCEVERLAENGFKEIVFVGIHIASYGIDIGKAMLSELLIRANKIDKIRRIRLSSIEPMTLNHKFIEDIKDCHKLCPHFHLSLQSGCDATLERMNRKYTASQYKQIVNGLRKHFPDAAITTDIMVGFPGETDDEFMQTCKFVKETAFADAHIFQYSQRSGTPAAEYGNQIDPKIKEARAKKIAELTAISRMEFLKSQLGKTTEVLFEQLVHGKTNWYEGKTDNYITVIMRSDDDIRGQFKTVSLKESDGNTITAINIHA